MTDVDQVNVSGEKLGDVLDASEEFSDHSEVNENALNRVANLPIVASTWTAMQNYYVNVKKTYPTVLPYLEAAENLTVSAANLALETSRPVVDRFGNTVNTYANKGLDTLESKVPIITKEPEEMLEITKSKATNMISSRVDGALGVTEQYVEYFLPRDDDGLLDEDADNDSSTEEDEVEIDPETKQPTERIREISNKVRQRSYKKAMKKLSGIQTRSKEALNKLSFTVDLIQYAQSSLNSTSAGIMDSANRANITVQNGVNTAKSNLQSVTSTINKQVEENVLQRAILLSRQLSDTCHWSIRYIKNSPQLQPLLKKATQVKESTDELYQMFANKTSLSQLPVAVLASARPKLLFVETSLLQILEKISDQPPIAWLTPSVDFDPFSDLSMEDIEGQLYARPLNDAGVWKYACMLFTVVLVL